ncbi:hypothetical protein SIID45300_00251 [Candidatus Magnetaquicoccaceae bacterium FCR-1]|uniref:RloB-like protein n=1 Tax=Candidatus Magnetaquiglobus chichijimensis TaxID=3141448 RepID=A0ABQ0C505_9PROT
MSKMRAPKPHADRRAGGRGKSRRLLILCEDTNSGFSYLDDLVRAEKLSGVKVQPPRKPYTDPLSIVRQVRDVQGRRDFDEVCAVFDGDCILRGGAEKNRFDQAIAQAQTEPAIEVYVSVPCIEFWFILHQGLTDASFSNCDEACQRFGQQVGMVYQKSNPKVFDLLKKHYPNGQSQAIRNAQLLREQQQKIRFSSPSTEIDRLISRLETFPIQ